MAQRPSREEAWLRFWILENDHKIGSWGFTVKHTPLFFQVIYPLGSALPPSAPTCFLPFPG